MNLVRFSLFNSALTFIAIFSMWYAGLDQLLWRNDVSHVSLLIIGIYLGATVYIGLARERASRRTLGWIAEGLTSLGLIGTVIGMMLAMHSGDTSFSGIMTLLVTTLTGMVSSLLLDLQIRFVLK